jgi:protein tyrosine phosphatase
MILNQSVLPRTFSKFFQLLFLVYEQHLSESLFTDTYIQQNTPGDSIINVILPAFSHGSLLLSANWHSNSLFPTQHLSNITNCSSLSGFDRKNSICLLKNYNLTNDQTLVLVGNTSLFNLDSLSFYKNCSMNRFDSINTHLLMPNTLFQVILYKSALNFADSKYINLTTSDLNYKRSILTDLVLTKIFPFNATLNWTVAFDVINSCNFATFCSINSFLITNSMYSYTNVTSTDIVSVINTTAYQQICKSVSITNSNSNFDCALIDSKIICSLNRVQLKPNSLYSFKIEAISSFNSNVSIWQQITSPDLLTGTKMPSFVGLTVTSPLKNQIGFSIFLPSINQTDVTILNLYLYLVQFCSLSDSANFSILNNFSISNPENCTRNTNCSIICLLQSYSNKEINFSSDITINVASASGTNKIAGPSKLLLVNSPIIKEDDEYSIFFVLKARNYFESSSLNDTIFTSPTKQIKVVADRSSGIKMPSFVGLKVTSPLKNQIGFSIFLPSINQTDVTILNLYLYLVQFCSLSDSANFSIPNNFSISNPENCTRNTNCSIICLLQSYSNNEINFSSDITINVVSDSDTNTIPEPSMSRLVKNPIIKKDVNYSTFFVLKARNIFESSSLNDTIFTSPITQIKVEADTSSGNSSNSSASIQDWQIILICCIVVVISLIIVGLVVAFVFRKRIKNSCRKCGSKYKPDIGSPYTADIPYKPLPSKSEFHCDDIKRICSSKRADDNFLFEKEFKSLPDYYNDKSSIAANDAKNATKNRYTDIKAYDESRVILKNEEDEELAENKDKLTDYINANYVHGYFYDKKFIATQGPKAETIGDFWRMIEQNNVKIIVMLTDLVENSVIKCQKYWPNALNTTETYDDYNVTFVDERVYVDYVKRTFNLMKTTKKDQSKIVTQYFYPSWVDKSTPNTDLISIFHLIREINWCYNGDKESPIVVHCSAGKVNLRF